MLCDNVCRRHRVPHYMPHSSCATLILSAKLVQAALQAEEKTQAFADACCDLVVTACELLQVSYKWRHCGCQGRCSLPDMPNTGVELPGPGTTLRYAAAT